MASLIVVPRDATGMAASALLGRFLRYHLLEDFDFASHELVFARETRLAGLLADAVPSAQGTLARIMIAGLGAPADPAPALRALERLDFLGVEVEWFDARAWADPELAARVALHARLVIARRRRAAAPLRFLHDALGLSDHRSEFILAVGRSASRAPWSLLVRAISRPQHSSLARERLRRLAFGSIRLAEEDRRLIAEEAERLRWLARDLALLVPFPVARTRTRQAMALVDVRKETGAPMVTAMEVAERVAARQRVRYTLVALSSEHAWHAHLMSWPPEVGDLAAVPALREAAEDGWRVSLESPSLAVLGPMHSGASFRQFARELAGKL